MNERIGKLAIQAMNYAELDIAQQEHWLTLYTEKFALLIIRECADLFDGTDPQSEQGHRIGSKIYQHFGVEL